MPTKVLLMIALVWPFFMPSHNKPMAEDKNTIEGTWVIVAAELSGQKLDSIRGTKLVLTAGRYQYQNDKGEYKLYPAEAAKAMDIVGLEGPNKGKTLLAIYELDGDKLTICYALTGQARPKEFKTEAGSRQFLAIYERERN